MTYNPKWNNLGTIEDGKSKIQVSDAGNGTVDIIIDGTSVGHYDLDGYNLESGTKVNSISNDSATNSPVKLLTAEAIHDLNIAGTSGTSGTSGPSGSSGSSGSSGTSGIDGSSGSSGSSGTSASNKIGAGTDNRIARYDGTEDVQTSPVTLDDSGNISGINDLSVNGDIGSITNEVQNIYLQDSLYFSIHQSASIYHNGFHFFITTTYGDIIIDSVDDIFLKTNSVNRWRINNAGNFSPYAANTYDIGFANSEIRNIYQGDSGHHYFGDDHSNQIHGNIGGLGIQSDLGSVSISTLSTDSIRFATNSIHRWSINRDGLIYPGVGNTYDIGTASFTIKDIYQGVNAIHYFGDHTEGQIYHDGTDFYIHSQNNFSDLKLIGRSSVKLFVYDLQMLVETSGTTIYNDLTITGNLNVDGTTFVVHNQEVTTTDNIIVVNYGEVGSGVTAGTAGMEVDRGLLTNYQFLFAEATDTFRIGEVGSLQAVATREDSPVDQGLAYWDTTSRSFITSSDLIFDGDILDVGTHISLEDDKKIYFGAVQNTFISHSGVSFYVVNGVGEMFVGNFNNDDLHFITNFNTRWTITSTGNFIPKVATTHDIGSSTYEVQHIYQGDNCYHYFGNDQDAQIYHNNTHFYMVTDTGNMNIGTTTTNSLSLMTNNIIKWIVDSNGNLSPSNANTYNIGSSTYEVKYIYQGDSGTHYFGSDQDALISHTGAVLNIYNSTGNMYIGNTHSASIVFMTDNTLRWSIDSAGHFTPTSTNSNNIGSITSEVRHIYQGDEGYHYFGSDQDARMVHDGSNFYMINDTGNTYINSDSSILLKVDSTTRLTLSTVSTTLSGSLVIQGTTKAPGYLYTGATDPTNTDRLNYDGYLYATRVYNAVYNDFADFQPLLDEKIEYGKCYQQTVDGCKLCNKTCQKGVLGIASDTYGSSVGQPKGGVPISVAGYVLGYVDKEYESGTPLMNDKDGHLTKMNIWRKLLYPERMIATYNKPEKELFCAEGKVEVKGRHWVKVK